MLYVSSIPGTYQGGYHEWHSSTLKKGLLVSSTSSYSYDRYKLSSHYLEE